KTVTISVNPPPSCQSASYSVVSGASVSVHLPCTTSGGAALTYSVDSGPSRGTLGAVNPATGNATYTPAPGYTGTDSLTFPATSSNGTSTTKTITLTVTAAPPPGPTGPTQPTAHPAAFRKLSMKARQHGKAISGSVIVAEKGSKFTGVLRFHGATVGRRTA